MWGRGTGAVGALALAALLAFGTLGGLAGGTSTPGSASSSAPAVATTEPVTSASSSGAGGATGATLQVPSGGGLSDPTSPHDDGNGTGASVLATLVGRGVRAGDVFLPNYGGEVHGAAASGHVSPTYTSAPAPFGIADLGLENLSGTLTPYTLGTSSVAATFSTAGLSGFSPDVTGPDEFGVQLNAVLNDVTILGNDSYQFWTQNVVEFTPSNHTLQFVDNLWNFSGGPFSANALYSYSGNLEVPDFYYGFSAPIAYSFPLTLELYLNSTVIAGRDAVFFNYSLSSGAGTFQGTYDAVEFNSLAAGAPASSTVTPAYEVNGFSYDPLGLPDDFEVTLTGPGGGSNFDVLESESTYLTLEYYNATAGGYANVPSAYNVGADTGETSYGVNSAWAAFSTNPGTGPATCADCAELTAGPSFLTGLWNVSHGALDPAFDNMPSVFLTTPTMDAFLFVARGDVWTGSWATTNWSEFAWAPSNFAPDGVYGTQGTAWPAGSYTIVFVEAGYAPAEAEIDLTNGSTFRSSYALVSDPASGVYTPLWAMNETAVSAISSGTDADGHAAILNDEIGELGDLPCSSSVGCATFPWFGLSNDYFYPVFVGVLLNDVSGVDLDSPASFSVTFPTTGQFARLVSYYGTPDGNDLGIYVNDSSEVEILGGTIAGWWAEQAYFGPSQSIGSVVFWNTTHSTIEGVTFETGGLAVFLYGGIDNTIEDNWFEPALFASPDPYSTVDGEYGSVGLSDADYGDAAAYGADAATTCLECDVVANNVFETTITATSFVDDPYTGELPTGYQHEYSEAWNLPYEAGPTNIIGGDYIGGNYWWDYGLAYNPYIVVPYEGLNPLPTDEFGDPAAFICTSVTALCSAGGGDFYPLVPVPVYRITFQETGLPTDTVWEVALFVTYTGGTELEEELESGAIINETYAPYELNLSEPNGNWTWAALSENGAYGALGGVVQVNGTDVLVSVDFVLAYAVEITETGLPAGSEWVGEITNLQDGVAFEAESTSTSVVIGDLVPGSYTYSAESLNGTYASSSADSGFTVVDTDLEVSVLFVPVYELTVVVEGLPEGVTFQLNLESTSGGYGGSLTGDTDSGYVDLPALTYTWTASAPGYVALPGSGEFALTGSMVLVLYFYASAPLVFLESGLPAGTEWSVTLSQLGSTAFEESNSTTIDVDAADLSYSYTASAADYVASPSSGSGTLGIAGGTVSIQFSAATGTLSGTIAPGDASLLIDGVAQTVGSGGTFSITLAVGVHSVEASAAGYRTYFDNVSIAEGGSVQLPIALQSTSSSSSPSGIGTLGWSIIAALVVLAVVLLITTLVFARRGRPPSPPAAYVPPSAGPPAGAVGAPPPAPWQEGPPPSPPS